jgi:hypothetical protein
MGVTTRNIRIHTPHDHCTADSAIVPKHCCLRQRVVLARSQGERR